MKKLPYAELLKQYPEYLTKEQMYKACHISKKTCRFLLQSGLIPCQDTGKKTRRYTIHKADIIKYLEDREKHPELFKPPAEYYKQKTRDIPRKLTTRDLQRMRLFYDSVLEDMPDVLTVKHVCTFTGYCNSSVVDWCTKGKLKCFVIKTQYFIPKEYLIDFFVSWIFIGIAVKSKEHLLLNQQIHTYLSSHS